MIFRKLIAWHHRHHNHTACLARRISRKLDLDEAQQAKFDNLHIVWNKARADLHKIRSERDEMLAAVMTAPEIDQDDLLRMVQIPQLSLNEEMPRVIEMYSDFHASLNPAQREQLLGYWQKYRLFRQCCHH